MSQHQQTPPKGAAQKPAAETDKPQTPVFKDFASI